SSAVRGVSTDSTCRDRSRRARRLDASADRRAPATGARAPTLPSWSIVAVRVQCPSRTGAADRPWAARRGALVLDGTRHHARTAMDLSCPRSIESHRPRQDRKRARGSNSDSEHGELGPDPGGERDCVPHRTVSGPPSQRPLLPLDRARASGHRSFGLVLALGLGRSLGLMLIAANWKMYKGPRETREFLDRFEPPDEVDVVICPSYTSLAAALESGFTIYAQNVHWDSEGPFTGEVSPSMLAELGVAGSIVGHSERRQFFGDTDETTAKRAEAALAAGLGVIACVGETEAEREANETEDVLRRQVSFLPQHDGLVVAYEPVWAIGTGQTATPAVCQHAHDFIKSLTSVPVLYGGSVKPENAAELLGQPAVDGALVGGASLDVDSFTATCRAAIP